MAAEAVPAKNGIMNGVNGAVELKLATTIAGEFVNSDYVELINTEDIIIQGRNYKICQKRIGLFLLKQYLLLFIIVRGSYERSSI